MTPPLDMVRRLLDLHIAHHNNPLHAEARQLLAKYAAPVMPAHISDFAVSRAEGMEPQYRPPPPGLEWQPVKEGVVEGIVGKLAPPTKYTTKTSLEGYSDEKLAELKDDLDKLYGRGQHAHGGNPCYGDGYFALSLKQKYGHEPGDLDERQKMERRRRNKATATRELTADEIDETVARTLRGLK